MLASVKIADLLLDGIYNSGPVQMLANHCFHYTYSSMKEEQMIQFHYVFLEVLCN